MYPFSRRLSGNRVSSNQKSKNRRHLRRFRPVIFEAFEPRLVLAVDPVTLALASTLATPATPKGVAIADFSGDGIPDLVCADEGASSVSVFRGNGDGTFGSAVNTAVPASSNPLALSVGDFNGDGRPDIAVGLYSGNSVAVFLTNADGSFAPAVTYAVGAQPTEIAVADFNADGKIDLAISNYNSGSITLLFGNGNGTFGGRADLGAAVGIAAVKAADLNGDGETDLVSANSVQNVATVMLGNGNGTFQSGVNYAAGNYSHRLTIADFDRDGKLDVVIGNYFGQNLTFLRGRGDGTLQAGVSVAVGTNVHDVVSGDLNGDGILDLAIAADVARQVWVLTGNGDGTFNIADALHRFNAGVDTAHVAVGDLNGNGTLDVAATNETSNTLQAWLNQATAANPHLSISVPASATVGTPFNVTVTARDAANAVATGFTGTVHFASSDRFAGLPANYTFAAGDAGVKTFSITLNTGGSQTVSAALVGSLGIVAGKPVVVALPTVSFGAPSNIAVGSAPSDATTADFNGDGIPDLAVTEWYSNGVRVLLGRGDGSFASSALYTTGSTAPTWP
jgi:hypothetical protein